VVRTPLIYTDAKILGLIGNVRTKLDALRAKGFHLSDGHYQQILRELGEL
jgi:predicted nucleic acid-binding protein